jgi:hypothetical protein
LEVPAALAEVLHRLEPTRSAASLLPPASPPLDLRQKEELATALLRVDAAHAAVGWFGERRYVPWWLGMIVGLLFFGVPLGILAGFLYDKANSPLRSSSEHFDARGDSIDEAGYAIAQRRVGLLAPVVGLLTGLGLTVLITFVLAWTKVYPWATLLSFLGSAGVLGVSTGLILGNLYEYYYRPFSQRGEYRSYSGENLDRVAYVRHARDAEVQGTLLGLATGYGAALVGTVFLVWRVSRRRWHLSQRLLACATELAATYPALVQSWGGTDRLHDRKFVQKAMELTES